MAALFATAAQEPAAVTASAPTVLASTSCFGQTRSVLELDLSNPWDSASFDKIYKTRHWKGSSSDPDSGPGSTLDATRVLCKTLQVALTKVTAKKPAGSTISILDVPSGDFFWMPHCLAVVDAAFSAYSFTYQGLDVSTVVVAMAEEKRAAVQSSLKNVRVQPFLLKNLADPGALQQFGHVDIILSHDCLQHNPTKNVRTILQNFNAAADYLVIDVDKGGQNEKDINVGECRYVDITRPPYNYKGECEDPNTGQKKGDEDEWIGIFKLPLQQ